MSKLLQKQVNEFIKSAGAAPAQKSAEWYLLKSKTIGGSEIATVMGDNPFKKVKDLIAEKIGICEHPFTGNIATRWGNTFEGLTREWTQRVLLMDEHIQETGSLAGTIDRQRYSPDGLGIVRLINEEDQLDYYIVLFEFKSPFRSLPDGKIPKQYRPQTQTGMMTIPMVDLSIFVSNCFRKCSIKDIGFNMTYDTNFHSGDLTKKITKKQKFTNVLACGIIGFYQTKENYDLALTMCGYNSDTDSDSDFNAVFNKPENTNTASNYSNTEYDIDLLMGTRETILDFGTVKSKMLDRLFELCEEKRIQLIYYPMILNQEAINELEFIQDHKKTKPVTRIYPKKMIKLQLDQFESHCEDNEYYPIGYLPWKLLKSDIIIDVRDEDWQTKIEPVITDTLQKIDEILAHENPKEKYLEYFPEVDSDVDVQVMDDDFMKPNTVDDDEVIDL